jgi:RHS repeat-associated protein
MKSKNKKSIVSNQVTELNVQKSNSSTPKINNIKQRISQAVSLLIILSILTVSVPASPKIIVESLALAQQDAAIFFNMHNSFSLFSWVSAGVPKQEASEEREANVVRIEIDSNNSTFLVGKQIQLFAVPYDQQDNPVSGIRFEWEITDPEGNLQEIENDIFTAKTVGEYTVKAKTSVNEGIGKFTIKNFSDESENKNKSQQSLPFDEWNVGNIPFIKNPKNERGNSPGKPKGKTNFNIAAPVLSIPGRGLNLDLSLYYNSLVWSKINQDISYDMDKDWLAPGWNMGFGKIINVINGGIVQVEADGTRRSFAGDIAGANDTVTFKGQSTDGSFIKSFTQTSVSAAGNCFYNPNTYLKYPNGTTVRYAVFENKPCYSLSESITMVPTRIQDRNGNQINISYHTPINNAPGRWINTISDTLGRIYTFNYVLDNGKYYFTSITAQGFPDVNGPPNATVTRTFVRLQYKNQIISDAFSGLTPHIRETTIKVVSAIYYPSTQTGYWFGDTDSYSPFGMIRKVDEHRAMNYSDTNGITQGVLSRERLYTYPTSTTTPLTDTPAFSQVTESWEGMTTPPTTTEYQVNWDSTPRITETISSDGSHVKEFSYNFTNGTDEEKIKDGLTYKTEFYDSASQLRSRSEIEWEPGHQLNTCPVPANGCVVVKVPRPKTVTQSQFENGLTFTKTTANIFGEYNQVQETKETGYGGVNDVLRKTVTEYIKKGDSPNNDNEWQSLPRLINMPTITQVYDSNNNRISYTKNEYDLNPVQLFSGADPTNFCNFTYCNSVTEKGNLSKTTAYENITNNSLTGELSNNLVYDRAGNLVQNKPEVTRNSLNTLKYTKNTEYSYPEETITGSDDNQVSLSLSVAKVTYNVNTGLPLTITDTNLQTSEHKHNANTWRLEKTILPTGGSTVFGYDDLTRVYSQTAYNSGNAIVGKQISKTNGVGAVYRQETFAKNENNQDMWDVVETTFDEFGRKKKVSNPFRTSSPNDHGVYWTEVFYDSIGRVWKTVAPDGSTKYDYFNEIARPVGASPATTAPGMTHRMKDPIGREKWYLTDSDGNMVEIIEPNPDGNGSVSTNGLVTKYSYDKLKRLVQTEQGSQLRKFKYDSLGRLTSQKMAETKATLDDNGAFVGESTGTWSDFYRYDKIGNVDLYKDARGVSTSYFYTNPSLPQFPNDPLNRIFSISYNTNSAADVLPSPTINYEYQPTGNVSQLKSITIQGVSTMEFGYDTRGRINQKTTKLLNRAAYPMTVNYVYDSLSRIIDVIYPIQHGTSGARKTVHYDFDDSGKMNNLKVDNVSYASDLVFNNFNQLTSVKIGPTGVNQITETMGYNPLNGLMENQKVLRGSTSLLDLSYQYQQCSCSTGGSGQITKITNNLDPNKNRKYDYDALARLKKVTGGINQGWSQEYKYDRYGNRTDVIASGFEALRNNEGQGAIKDEQKNIAKESASITPPTSEGLLSEVRNSVFNKPGSSKPNKTDSVNSAGNQAENTQESESAASLPVNRTPFDFDNDGKADTSAWQRSNGLWSVIKSSNNQTVTDQFGSNGNQIAPGDYDGDGKTDEAVWVPSTGDWWIKYSSTNSVVTIHWGTTGDTIVPADYDGDGKTDIAVWRASQGYWYVLRSSNGTWFGAPLGGGQFGDIPVASDFDGDAKADLAVWRPSTGVWYVYQTSNGQLTITPFGSTGDVPVQSDFDGDSKTDFAVWRPSTGVWYYLKSATGGFSYVQFGSESLGDVLVPADYDGDRKTDVAVFRPSTSVWYILRSSDGGVSTPSLGNSGHVPVPSAYIRRSSAPKGQSVPIPRDGFANMSYDQNSNRISTAGFLYDLAGNQTQSVKEDGTVSKFQYDAAGRLIKVKNASDQTIVTYTYGESRERLVTQDGDDNSTNRTYYAWDNGSVIGEYTDSPTNTLKWTKNYVFMGGRLLATHEQAGNAEVLQFSHSDQLGTRLVSNPATGTSFEQTTLPFGTALESESTGATNRRFTSYDRSASTGMDYAINRFYNSSQGRFTTVDPIKMRATSRMNPQTLNLYAYTANDPINRTDPDGLFWGALFGFIGGFFKKTNFNFTFSYHGTPFSIGLLAGGKNVFIGVAGFTVQVTGKGSIFNQISNFFKPNLITNSYGFMAGDTTDTFNEAIKNAKTVEEVQKAFEDQVFQQYVDAVDAGEKVPEPGAVRNAFDLFQASELVTMTVGIFTTKGAEKLEGLFGSSLVGYASQLSTFVRNRDVNINTARQRAADRILTLNASADLKALLDGSLYNGQVRYTVAYAQRRHTTWDNFAYLRASWFSPYWGR